jgi:hypothetical protein
MLEPFFFSLIFIAHRCLTYIKCGSTVFEAHKHKSEFSYSVTIFHQTIRGLRNKSEELLHSFEIYTIGPDILCLSEHHMVEQGLLHLSISGYQLGPSFCRKRLQRGGVCIFVKIDQHFNNTDISHHCKEQDLEISAMQLVTKTENLIILSMYRAPSADIYEFLKILDVILQYLYSSKSKFIICCHISANYLNEKNRK